MDANKICYICNTEKPLSDYYTHCKSRDRHLNKCKLCCSEYSKQHHIRTEERRRKNYRERSEEKKLLTIEKRKLYRKKNADKMKSWSLKKSYGITLHDYNEMLINQNGVCAICNKQEQSLDWRTKSIRNLAVDHHHGTNKIRGLLCMNCNTAIGLLKEDLNLIKLLYHYLNKHSNSIVAL
jgi:hypothetical protein